MGDIKTIFLEVPEQLLQMLEHIGQWDHFTAPNVPQIFYTSDIRACRDWIINKSDHNKMMK